MKFGDYLKSNLLPEWRDQYLDYDKLKDLIKRLEEQHVGIQNDTGIGMSLTVPIPTNAAGMPASQQALTQEEFFKILESEMHKIEEFTHSQVDSVRDILHSVESEAHAAQAQGPIAFEASSAVLRQRVESAGETFLKLEKYVNLNFTGFHKILKKHDKRLPNPCKSFYVHRLHEQSWVRGDYSDVLVAMSRVYSLLRGDEEIEAKESDKQDFVRSTRKYWVHTEDVSAVKCIVLQHLPVFLQKTMAGETDSQLVNSVYLDNDSLELYHGRLDKSPGAIALRMRWYGTGIPELVFVERKTHRESWCGDISVKERFTVPEAQVPPLIAGTFDLQAEINKMQSKGKSADAIEEWRVLASEVVQAINSKQLYPTMRTQYMRTAFQIPFDATVRISLDTNLCMISERTKDVSAGKRWYRDPNYAVPLNEITRFPHAVLEIKLQLEDENSTPVWVQDLLDSGMLLEVHKFSKFIHGCAVLLPQDVVGVPYWIDDPTLASSIKQSGAESVLELNEEGANAVYSHLLPHTSTGQSKGNVRGGGRHSNMVKRRSLPAPDKRGGSGLVSSGSLSKAINIESQIKSERGWQDWEDNTCLPPAWCDFADSWRADRGITGQKVEPKLFFAAERTFIKWMEMGVVLSSVAVGILAFTKSQSNSQFIAFCMLPLSLMFVAYGLRQLKLRQAKIRSRSDERWDDPYGPVVLTVGLIFGLLVQFVITARNMSREQ